MSRPTDEEQARTITIALRITPRLRVLLDSKRGPLSRSAYLRKLIEEAQ